MTKNLTRAQFLIVLMSAHYHSVVFPSRDVTRQHNLPHPSPCLPLPLTRKSLQPVWWKECAISDGLRIHPLSVFLLTVLFLDFIKKVVMIDMGMYVSNCRLMSGFCCGEWRFVWYDVKWHLHRDRSVRCWYIIFK